MRGSTPLDVAASSVMDNNGLALALEEPDLDKVRLIVTPDRVEFYFAGIKSQDGETRGAEETDLPCEPAGGHLPGGLWSPELPHAPG